MITTFTLHTALHDASSLQIVLKAIIRFLHGGQAHTSSYLSTRAIKFYEARYKSRRLTYPSRQTLSRTKSFPPLRIVQQLGPIVSSRNSITRSYRSQAPRNSVFTCARKSADAKRRNLTDCQAETKAYCKAIRSQDTACVITHAGQRDSGSGQLIDCSENKCGGGWDAGSQG
jgi:hypothetical protein